ncbi:MAG: tetratricopeptide repeat protein [Bradymonadaceae bacterium]
MIRFARWMFLFIIFIVALSACRSTPAQPDPVLTEKPVVAEGPTAQELFLKGNAFLDKRQWEAAISAYDEAIALDPGRWDAYMNRGIAYSASPNFELALNSMELALDNGGASEPAVYFNLGNIYQNSGLFSQAVKAYRMGMAIEGKLNFESLLNLGAAYTFLNEHELAQATLLKAVELRPEDPRPRLSLALLLQVSDQIDEAIAAYEDIHQMDPDYAPAYFNRGSLLHARRDFAESSKAFERYLSLEPEGPYVRRAQNRLDRARQELEKER